MAERLTAEERAWAFLHEWSGTALSPTFNADVQARLTQAIREAQRDAAADMRERCAQFMGDNKVEHGNSGAKVTPANPILQDVTREAWAAALRALPLPGDTE